VAALISLAVGLALQSAPVEADTVERWRPFIEEASIRSGIPSAWIERVMRAESGGRTALDGRPITSRAGAMGLMQLMPATWAEMRAVLGLGTDPHDPRDNILAGAAYLRLMYDRFGYPGLFGAYNSGPARYAASLATGRPLPAETRAYLAKVGRSRPAESVLRRNPPAQNIFFEIGRRAKSPASAGASDTDRMFIALWGMESRPSTP
jgi:soluble lytic murein transglycosylase-like protein